MDQLEATISFPTGAAVQAAKDFAAQLATTTAQLDAVSAASLKAEKTVGAVGDNTKKAADGLKKVADAAKPAAKELEGVATNWRKIGKTMGDGDGGVDPEKKTNALAGATSKLAQEVTGLVKGYLGLQAVVAILDAIEKRFEAIKNARRDLVGERQSVDQQVRALAFNLGLKQDEAGLARARQIQEQFVRAAPGATAEQISGAIGSGASFGLDPSKKSDAQVLTLVARVAATLDLSKQTTGDLVKFLAAQNATTPEKAAAVLSQFLQAARTTPVENQADFADAFIRATLPLVERKVSLSQAAGFFSAAAVGEPSALKTATRVQQVTAVVEGKDDTTSAALLKRAADSGILSAKDAATVAKAQRDSLRALTPDQKAKQEAIARALVDLDADEKREEISFKRDIDGAERDRIETKRKAHSTKDVEDRIAQRREQHDADLRGFTDRHAVQANEKRQLAAAGAQRNLAQVYRAIPIAERLRIFSRLVENAQGPGELDKLMEMAGATPEEQRYVAVATSPAAQAQGRATEAAVAGARSTEAAEAAGAFEGTNLAQNKQSQEIARLNAAGSVTSGEQYAVTFSKEMELYEVPTRLKSGDSKWSVTVRFPFSGRTNKITAISDRGYRQAVSVDVLLNRMKTWFDALPDEDKQYVKSSGWYDWMIATEKTLAKHVETSTIDFGRIDASIMQAATEFGNLLRIMTDRQAARGEAQRKANPGGGRTGAGASGAPGASGGGSAGGTPPASSGGVGGASGETPRSAGEAYAPAGGGAVAVANDDSRTMAGAYYQINIGTVVSNGGNALDFAGALENEA